MRGAEELLKLLQASSCFRGDVCSSLPCACAESLARQTAALSPPVKTGGEAETIYGQTELVPDQNSSSGYSLRAAALPKLTAAGESGSDPAEPMDITAPIRCGLARAEAGHESEIDLEDIAKLLDAYDRLVLHPAQARLMPPEPYWLPFKVVGGCIRDAKDNYVAELSSPFGGDVRDQMAQFLVTAVNATAPGRSPIDNPLKAYSVDQLQYEIAMRASQVPSAQLGGAAK